MECGGLERNVSIICNNIDTNRYSVTLAVLNNANPFFFITNKDVKVLDLKILNVRKSLIALLKLTRKIKPHIILTTANHLNLFVGMFRWMFPRSIRIIARESSIVSVNTQRTWNPRLYHWLLRRFYRKIDLVVCQSEYMRQDLVKNYNIRKKKTRVIYNPIIEPETAADWQQTNSAFIELITVARLSEEKGLDRLIRCVAALKRPYRFTIIGEGSKRASLQKQINDMQLNGKVFLAGSSSKPFSIIPKPDLFLMGSYYEGFPNAMLESLSLGIPVVAFDAPGGISELLIEGRNGFLVTGNNESLFTQTIEKAIANDFNREDIRQKTLTRFNVNVIMCDWYEVLKINS